MRYVESIYKKKSREEKIEINKANVWRKLNSLQSTIWKFMVCLLNEDLNIRAI